MLAKESSFMKAQGAGSFNSEGSLFEFEDHRIGDILVQMNYPNLFSSCFQCTKQLNLSDKADCNSCFRSFHKSCKFASNFQKSENCRFCQENTCISCNKIFYQLQSRVKCSICLRSKHQSCWNMPLQLLEESKAFYKKLNSKMTNFKRIVCEECTSFWKTVPEAVISVKIQQVTYQFAQINHPSPIHYTWQTCQKQITKLGQKQDLVIIEESKAIIENIFSIYLASPFDSLNVGCAFKYVKQEKKENQKILFLVKWQDREEPVWEFLETVRPYSQLIRNFFIKLNLNRLLMKKEDNRQKVRVYISNLANQWQDFKKMNYFSKETQRQSTYQHEEALRNVYQHYSINRKQKILSSIEEEDHKISVICSLINTIMFVDKKAEPVFLFAEKCQMKRWAFNLRQQCPLHKCLLVSGSEKYLRKVISHYFYTEQAIIRSFRICSTFYF